MSIELLKEAEWLSFSDLQERVKVLSHRSNLLTEMEATTIESIAAPSVTISEQVAKIEIPNVGAVVASLAELKEDYDESIEKCEDENGQLQDANADLQNENDALNLAAQDEESVGSVGNRISVATHIFDYTNATVIQTDIWKYEMWTIMSPGNPFIEFNLRKTAISRDPAPGFPEQSSIRMVRPDETTFDQGSYIQSLSSTPSGLLNVGDVWTFQYGFEDAQNYLGDTNIINTGFIDVFTVTIIKDISTGFVPGEIYVRIDVKAIGVEYDTKSGASI